MHIPAGAARLREGRLYTIFRAAENILVEWIRATSSERAIQLGEERGEEERDWQRRGGVLRIRLVCQSYRRGFSEWVRTDLQLFRNSTGLMFSFENFIKCVEITMMQITDSLSFNVELYNKITFIISA